MIREALSSLAAGLLRSRRFTVQDPVLRRKGGVRPEQNGPAQTVGASRLALLDAPEGVEGTSHVVFGLLRHVLEVVNLENSSPMITTGFSASLNTSQVLWKRWAKVNRPSNLFLLASVSHSTSKKSKDRTR